MPWENKVSPKMILQDIARIFLKGELRPTFFRYRDLGGYHGIETIRRCFGQWSKAVYAWEHGLMVDEASPPQQKIRTCLRCPKTFMSHGPGNRLCNRCREFLGRESFARDYAFSNGGIREIG